MGFCRIEEALQDLKKGKFLIVVDDARRENEGDLVCAGEKITPAKINFMARQARGLICAPISAKIAARLHLSPMASTQDSFGTAFTVSVDAVQGTTTGISASDRAKTVAVLCNPRSKPQHLLRPGHLFPLQAKEGGVLRRTGHTEAVVDLLHLAGLREVGVICEIMRENGKMARLPDLKAFAKKHKIKLLTIEELVAFRLREESFVKRKAEALLPTRHGTFKAVGYENTLNGGEFLALVKGDISPDSPTLVRVHSGCITGDIFHSRRCDCGEQLQAAMQAIEKEGKGAIVYIQEHEGRGIGLVNKLRAYALQEKGMDTVKANQALGFPMDLRDYGTGAQILRDLGVCKMRLLTNNLKKMVALAGYGLEVVGRVSLEVKPNPHNLRYLKTKKKKMGHLLEEV